MIRIMMVSALALAGVTTPALAGPTPQGRFSGDVSVGAEFPVDGDVHGGRTTGALPLSAVAPLLTPVPALPGEATSAQLRIQSRSFDDIYGEAQSVRLEGAYGLGGGREVFGSIGYVEADEGQVQVGTAALLNAGGADLAEVPVFGRFGAYEATTVEAGVRQFFNLESPVKPYVAGRIGAAFVDEIRASFTIPALNLISTLNDVAFYDETTAITAGVDVGVAFDVSPQLSFAVETGLRYAGDLDGNDSTLRAIDLAPINEEGSRISVPLTLKARLAF